MLRSPLAGVLIFTAGAIGTSSQAEPFPPLLSQTGMFSDLSSLTPAPGFHSYEINAPFWSDGAAKRRWLRLPSAEARVAVGPDGEWAFPLGTVFLKHFELESTSTGRMTIPVETRILAQEENGNVSGASYRWRANGSDADLVTSGTTDVLPHSAAPGGPPVRWYFPGTADCGVCHTAASGGVLGVNARQLNRTAPEAGAGTENQLARWARAGLLPPEFLEAREDTLPRLADVSDDSASLEHRARSYLDVNCAQCHRPGGAAGHFDARFSTPLARQNLINGPVLIDLGLDKARVVAPNDPWRSVLLARVETHDGLRMPPLGRESVDAKGAALLRRWILSLPGPPVLEPPRLLSRRMSAGTTVTLTLSHPDPAATLRYTLDGRSPGPNSPAYTAPLTISPPATVRARAYRQGWTRSIPVQETFGDEES